MKTTKLFALLSVLLLLCTIITAWSPMAAPNRPDAPGCDSDTVLKIRVPHRDSIPIGNAGEAAIAIYPM